MRLDSSLVPPILANLFCVTPCVYAEDENAEPAALRVEAAYAAEALRQVSGGLRTGTRYLDGISFSVTMDGEQLAGWNGATAYLGIVHGNGETISDLSGAQQSITGIEGTSATRVPELWFEQSFGSSGQSLRLGLYDVGSEFAKTNSGDIFFNQSQTMTPEFSSSGVNGPSTAPATGLGLRYGRQIGAWSGRLAVLDGDPGAPEEMSVQLSHREGALILSELDYEAQSGLRLGSGYWRYTARFADLRATDSEPLDMRRDNQGIYGFIETPVHVGQSGNALLWSARCGVASPRINEIARSYGTGLTYSTSSPRPLIVGVAAGVAELGSPARFARAQEDLRTTAREYSYEVTAGLELTESVMLKADVQRIVHPGMDPTLAAAWIFGFRIEVARQWSW